MSGNERVVIRGIAAGGDGVATLADGRTVFVPRTAPGDDVMLRSIRRQARFARAEIAEVLIPGPGRVEPPCPHYLRDRCGSCQLQHLDGDTQRVVRQRIVGDAMRRIARLETADPAIAASGSEFGYRASITLSVRGRIIGYHRLGAPEQIVDIHDCLLARESLRRLLRELRAARTLLPDDTEHVVLREDAEGGIHLVIRTAGRDGWTGAADLAQRLTPGVHIWWHPAGGAARVMTGDGDRWPATVFAQVNPPVAALVRTEAIERLGDVSGRRVWDLYAGIGESTALLQARGAQVESVERDPRAVALAEQRGPAGPRRHAGDANDWVSRLGAPDAVLTNPPRTGMDELVTTAIAGSTASRLVYISCDPATLARDIRRLSERFRVASLTAWDQFPQTAHVECVAVLEAL